MKSLADRPPAALRSLLVEAADVGAPLFEIGTQQTAVVAEQAIDLTLDVSRLRVDGAAARVTLNVVAHINQELGGASVPRGDVGY